MEKKKILVIDDEVDMAQLVKLNLERTEKYEVILAHDGEAGLKKVDKEDPDLVILDVMMPKKNGFEVLKELRKPGIKWRPIIMLTTKEDGTVKAYNLEADFYITKPFDKGTLIKGIETILPLASIRIRDGEKNKE